MPFTCGVIYTTAAAAKGGQVLNLQENACLYHVAHQLLSYLIQIVPPFLHLQYNIDGIIVRGECTGLKAPPLTSITVRLVHLMKNMFTHQINSELCLHYATLAQDDCDIDSESIVETFLTIEHQE